MRSLVTSDDGGGTRAQSMTIGGVPKVRSGTDGVAVVEHVPPGSYEAVVTHRAHAEGCVSDIAVVDRQVTEAGSLRLEPAGTIRGSVVADDGAVDFAIVECRPAGDENARPQTSIAGGGAFVIDGLAPGEYELRARLPSPGAAETRGPPVRAAVRAGETSRVELRTQ